MSQSDAVYEVVSLQREAERNIEEREQVTSHNEEEDVDEGMLLLFVLLLFSFLLFSTVLGEVFYLLGLKQNKPDIASQ